MKENSLKIGIKAQFNSILHNTMILSIFSTNEHDWVVKMKPTEIWYNVAILKSAVLYSIMKSNIYLIHNWQSSVDQLQKEEYQNAVQGGERVSQVTLTNTNKKYRASHLFFLCFHLCNWWTSLSFKYLKLTHYVRNEQTVEGKQIQLLAYIVHQAVCVHNGCFQ